MAAGRLSGAGVGGVERTFFSCTRPACLIVGLLRRALGLRGLSEHKRADGTHRRPQKKTYPHVHRSARRCPAVRLSFVRGVWIASECRRSVRRSKPRRAPARRLSPSRASSRRNPIGIPESCWLFGEPVLAQGVLRSSDGKRATLLRDVPLARLSACRMFRLVLCTLPSGLQLVAQHRQIRCQLQMQPAPA